MPYDPASANWVQLPSYALWRPSLSRALNPIIVVYTTSWCSDCKRSKRLLASLEIPFTEIEVEQSEGAETAMRAINGDRHRVPTIWIDGETVLVEPSDSELLVALKPYFDIPSESPEPELETACALPRRSAKETQ